ncbi:hypothetical protein ASPWEDRAFT_640729 [Aspergillus wentii DTO 134E9]|uniref:Uncharacterized protein n=1 Tax=Aspergillus wentii DTO 134E9 TaxID=1073089 RepID=A0A1L9RAA5_ASPWE|nr:uncharacterized protein ASPWEDRAFT_640729 [Aspergillus wentii DTO 134E9]OJJ31865.1 hypothetical protein ASPWEDRAFT_640729 [Aspergillus wentii DTO 134E9]
MEYTLFLHLCMAIILLRLFVRLKGLSNQRCHLSMVDKSLQQFIYCRQEVDTRDFLSSINQPHSTDDPRPKRTCPNTQGFGNIMRCLGPWLSLWRG